MEDGAERKRSRLPSVASVGDGNDVELSELSAEEDGGAPLTVPKFGAELRRGRLDERGTFLSEKDALQTVDETEAEFRTRRGFGQESLFYGSVIPVTDVEATTAAARIDLRRLLPGLLQLPSARLVPLCATADWLEPEFLAELEAELEHVVEQVEANVPVDVPKSAAYANIDDQDYVDLVQVLYDLGLVELISPADALVFVGIFGVDKRKLGVSPELWAQRLITDLRRTNAHIRLTSSWFKCHLPSPEDLAKLMLDPGAQLLVGQSDLTQCFYRCGSVGALSRLCCLPEMALTDLHVRGADGAVAVGGQVVPALVVVPMGFVLAPVIVQHLHARVVRQALAGRKGVLVVDRSADIQAFTRLHANQSVLFLYLDDNNIFGINGPDMRAVQAVVKADGYKPARLIWSEEKEREAGQEALSSVLGIVASREGTLAMAEERVRQYVHFIDLLIERGVVSGHKLAEFCGRFCWTALLRRTALSALYFVFTQMTALGGPKARALTARPWHTVVQELHLAKAMIPRLKLDLRQDVGPVLFATDASSFALGATYVDGLARETLLDIVRAEALTDQGPLHGTEQHEWKTFLSMDISETPVYQNLHITTLELAAVYFAVVRATKRLHWRNKTILVLVDNTAALAMSNKGRSRSRHQLDLMRRIDQLLEPAECRIACRYISTDFNPADDPSRLRTRRRPAQ